MKTKTIIAAILLVAAVGLVTAQNTNRKSNEIRKTCYVDTNKNNVCDKYERKKCTIGNGSGKQDCIKPKSK